MPENSSDQTAFGENRVGPDFFGLYAREVAELLSQDEALFPFAGPNADKLCEMEGDKSSKTAQSDGISGPASLYSNAIGSLLSEFRKERFKALLQQSVFVLSKEVDEMTDPVNSVNRIRALLRHKESPAVSNASSKSDHLKHRRKKQKVSTETEDIGRETRTNDVSKEGTHHSEASNAELKIDDDLKLILENDRNKVEELMQKHGGELFATLQHMESKLEDLLDAVMAASRPMTSDERQSLRISIGKLAPKNLERVAEIIGRNKPSDDDLEVDLDDEDNGTLWKLFFYVASSSS